MYKPKYFKAYELVDKHTYQRLGETSYRLFDRGLLILADHLREIFGSCVINDWYWKEEAHEGEAFQYSGLRRPNTPYYREFSRHSHGAALDLKFSKVPAETVRQYIKDNFELIQSITGLYSITLEEGVSWVHIQVDNKSEGVHTFTP